MSGIDTSPFAVTPADFYIERTSFAGAIVGTFLYGILFVLVLVALRDSIQRKALHNIKWGTVVYVVFLFCGATLYLVSNTRYTEQMLIDYGSTGGPIGYYLSAYNTPTIIYGNSAFIFNNFLADGLLLWRTWMVWGRNWYIIAFPILVFCGSSVMSIISVYQLAQPGAHFFSHIGLTFALPYFSLSVSLNLLLTIMIVFKLLLSRQRLRSSLGPEHARIYTGIAAMVVESAAIYSLFSIMFIATYSINNSFFNVCLPIQAQGMCISPLLIMIRVARGRAFSQDNVSGRTSDMSFAKATNTTATLKNRSETMFHGTEMEKMDQNSESAFPSASKLAESV